MKKLLILCICGLCSGCASEPKTTEPQAKPGLVEKAMPDLNANIAAVKVGMTRTEVERLLGEPSAVTDKATATTLVWVFAPGAQQATPVPEPKSNSRGVLSVIGGIAATIAGIFNPIAGVATSVGTQVYNASTIGNNDAEASAASNAADTRIVTIELHDNRVFSVQRAKSGNNVPAATVR